MVKHTFKILRCLHRKILKEPLAIFQNYGRIKVLSSDDFLNMFCSGDPQNSHEHTNSGAFLTSKSFN